MTPISSLSKRACKRLSTSQNGFLAGGSTFATGAEGTSNLSVNYCAVRREGWHSTVCDLRDDAHSLHQEVLWEGVCPSRHLLPL